MMAPGHSTARHRQHSAPCSAMCTAPLGGIDRGTPAMAPPPTHTHTDMRTDTQTQMYTQTHALPPSIPFPSRCCHEQECSCARSSHSVGMLCCLCTAALRVLQPGSAHKVAAAGTLTQAHNNAVLMQPPRQSAYWKPRSIIFPLVIPGCNRWWCAPMSLSMAFQGCPLLVG